MTLQTNRMKKGLAISADGSLTLPTDAITQTIVVYGGKGKGKTNFGTVLAEEFYRNGLKFSALDPYGVMWGLRHGQTKSEKGLEILILGGVHGDLPILPTSGAVVADLVSDEAISTVVDISRDATGKMWSKGSKIRFVADYATRLFERQGEHQRPIMQIIDEAGRYCPQTIPHGSVDLARCVGAIEELVEVGRNVGIGVTLITQRSARMNKSVSELAEAMVAFCTLGPNSVEAITDWAGEHIERSRWKELVAEIRKLPRGTAMVVSPSWLGLEGKIVPFRARSTFDSSATPRAGTTKRRPGAASMPSLDRYKARMVEVEKEAALSNPAELRKQVAAKDARIAALEKQVRNVEEANATRTTKTVPVNVPVPTFDAEPFDHMVETIVAPFEKMVGELKGKIGAFANELGKHADTAEKALQLYRTSMVKQAKAASSKAGHFDAKKMVVQVGNGKPIGVTDTKWIAPPTIPKKQAEKLPGTVNDQPIRPARQAILNALVFLEGIGVEHPERAQVGVMADQLPATPGFANNLGWLRTAGLVTYPSETQVALTAAGRSVASHEGVPKNDEEIRATIMGKLRPARRKILQALLDAYPESMDRNPDLAEASEQEPGSPGFANNLGWLRTAGLIDYPSNTTAIACSIFFVDGAS